MVDGISNLIKGRSAASVVLIAGALLFSGCDRGPAMSQVRGKVVYTDGSVPQAGVAVVRMEPTADTTAEVRRGASGGIQPDGTFEMFTIKPGDGVYHGEYAVTFNILKGVMDPKPLVPQKYMDKEQTPYKITVDRNISDLKFEIEPLPRVRGRAAAGGAQPPAG